MARLTHLLFLLVVGWAAAEVARYDHYQVYNIMPRNMAEVKLLQGLQQQTSEFSFWTDRVGLNRPVVVMVAPSKRPLFHDFVTENGLDASVRIENVQELIDSQAREAKDGPKAFDWNDYHKLDEIYAWLDGLASSNSKVEVVVGGTTYEGRQIKGIKINNGAGLPGVILESGIHAREWIGPASSSWIVNEILNSASDSVWRKFNYLYFPNVNPDGYVYTWTNDRMWRKTRQPYKVAGVLTCYGADPNRNWGFHWMEGGASNNPCAEDFAGRAAFSEVEVQSLSDYYTSVSSNYDIYIAFHSFSQLLMFPWGYTGEPAANAKIWQRIGDLAAADLKAVHGTSFDVGNIHDTIYPASGSSIEWYYGLFNSTLTYTFEGRDTGKNGFLLPADEIVPSGEELKAACSRMLSEYLKL